MLKCPFLPENAEHVYFFRRWSRDDFRYYAPWLETVYEVEPWNNVLTVNNQDDNKPEFASGEEYLGWLGRQLPCLQPFLPQNAEHFYFCRRWSRNDLRYYAHYLDTHLEEDIGESLTGENDEDDIKPESAAASGLCRQPPGLEEENENKEYIKECCVNGHDTDTKELEDEVNPYIKLMLQPTVFYVEVLMTQNPLSLVEICSKSIPTELTRDMSRFEDKTTLSDYEQPTEQKCQKARKWNSSFKFKFLRRNRKDREDKKRSPGFLSRFFR
ncbi:uncharacterized protein LOC134257736 [Saccostrea cucullata]|uniref:uncharacterized protein LOC134257736 n=1 Tax=Saccostrea cuccullata TaxID=36930 RepID=UPI002ED63527